MTDTEKIYSILTDCKNPLHWLFRNNADFLNLAKYLTNAGVTVQSWVPVTERLPDETPNSEGISSSELALVVVKDYSLDSRFVSDDITVHGEWHNYNFPDYEVTHWMPLPEPPKEVKQ